MTQTKTIMAALALLCAGVPSAWAEDVTFNVRSWNGSEVVTTQTTKDATALNSYDESGDGSPDLMEQ